MGKRKMYKKGLADGLAANLPFAEKQKAAIEHVRKEIKEGKDPLLAMKDLLQEDVGNIYEFLTNQEKALLYKLASPLDIRELESAEKQLLVAMLYQLADDMDEAPTEQQRVYIRSIQQYLGVVNPQTSVDLRVVEDIDSLEVQRAFKQIALEFFYLQDSNELSDQQEEFLGYFSLNRHQSEAIELIVSQVYNAIGPEGLATHYGPALDEAVAAEQVAAAQAQPVPNEEIVLDQTVGVPHGEETVYQNKIIHIRSQINCDGALAFENCELHYGEPDGCGQIAVAESGALKMKNSKIKYHGYTKAGQYFITAKEGRGAVVMDGCEVVDAGVFIQAERDVVLRSSKMTNVGGGFVNCDRYNGEVRVVIEDCAFSFPKWSQERETDLPVPRQVIDGQTVDMSRCLVEGDFRVDSISAADEAQEVRNDITFLGCKQGKVSQCSFRGMNNIWNGGYEGKMAFSLTSFEHCVSVIYRGIVDMADCRIEYTADFVRSLEKGSRLTNCQFNECYLTVISSGYDGGVGIKNCEFNNWETKQNSLLEFCRVKKEGSRNDVCSCVFNGMQAHSGFVVQAGTFDKLDGYVASVDDCQFINCTTDRDSGKIIKAHDTYYGVLNRAKEQVVASVNNCSGLDEINQGSGRSKKVKRKLTNAAGERIGVQLDEQKDEQSDEPGKKPAEEGKVKRFLTWLMKDD